MLAPLCALSPPSKKTAALKNAAKTQDGYSLPIIMYHSTFKNGAGKYRVTPAQLQKDLIFIKEQGFTTITIGDVIAYKENGRRLPAKPIMLTFDDGYTNNYLYAFPLFKKYNMKCVMSVVGALIDANYKNGVKNETHSHVTYEQIKEMNDSGLVEIQNHSYNLHLFKNGRYGLKKNKGENAADYEKLLKTDLTKLQSKLKEKTGIVCTALTFPFGGYSRETFNVMKDIGLKAGLSCNAGINKITRDSSLFCLHRDNRPYGLSSAEYFKKIKAV
jgi:peptidoglycan/xylan/chitin deacetylase (PgdA/CDA1 family)